MKCKNCHFYQPNIYENVGCLSKWGHCKNADFHKEIEAMADDDYGLTLCMSPEFGCIFFRKEK